ncbi:hypothetical protein D8Y20_09920 [Mariprofundus sp. EBB-1]|uniref:hypothetical protein n=1 Tax=Mariprofundus sp. EBB-1 TaxID=2650971 RepID=UPI000EF205A2|nr:hypothetical protein [Mariprofundus sp. EBB-1]RLL51172.1 hypothetical protein D8Y20_09920 [Mariprofundus sp. EBB-1]
MKESENDWRMHNIIHVGEDCRNPWTGKTIPKGTQITFVSVVPIKKKKHLTIALPNATALCLNISKRSWAKAKELRKDAKIDSSLRSEVSFESHSDAFDYIERVMESVVMAFTALEAFANEIIPDDYEYHSHRKSEIILETMNKTQIERWLSLDEKLTSILPEILELKSPKGNQSWQGYQKLKKVRDRIIHMKKEDRRSSGPEIPTLWHELFKVGSPFVQAKDIIDYFIKAVEPSPRWHNEYPK